MSVCIVKQGHLCSNCSALCHHVEVKDMETLSAIELNDLCLPCVRALKSSYVDVVSYKHSQDLIDRVKANSPWCRSHRYVEAPQTESA
jgi:hypothetical protein